jgi:hypothetical protein
MLPAGAALPRLLLSLALYLKLLVLAMNSRRTSLAARTPPLPGERPPPIKLSSSFKTPDSKAPAKFAESICGLRALTQRR